MPDGSDDGRRHEERPTGPADPPATSSSTATTATTTATAERPALRPTMAPGSGPRWRQGSFVLAAGLIALFLGMAGLLIWQATHSDWRRQLPVVDGVSVTTPSTVPNEVTRS